MLPHVVDEAVERSAAPAAVGIALAHLCERHVGLPARLEADESLRTALVTVTGASRFLTRLLVSTPAALEVLADLDTRPPLLAVRPAELAAWKRLELLRIAARDLVGVDRLEAVVEALTQLADDVLGCALRLAGNPALVVVAMGKLGGRELNYASDVDVLFVGDGATEAEARRVMEVARTCFRVDADLRPEGRDGPLVRSLESFEAYWDRWASTWEFQALMKARPVAGDERLGRAFLEAAQRRVWQRPFGAEELRAVRAMKARAEGEMLRRGLSDREVKRGRGGIRDIEFAVQLLQLVHGRQDATLRIPATLPALRELASAGYVEHRDAGPLATAYRFLRTVEHRLQLVEDQQVHAVPSDVRARTQLARVLGYRDDATGTAIARFDADLRRHQATVRSIHERLFFRPLLDTLAAAPARVVDGPAMTPEAVATRLAAFGFTDAERTRQALGELTRGLTRSSRLMQQMLPLLLGWLSESPDPDLGLLGLRTLADRQHRAEMLVRTFRDSPEAARRLCLLLGTSRLLATGLARNPDLIAALGDDRAMAARSPAETSALAQRALAWRGEVGQRRQGLRHLRQAEELRVAARDVLGLDEVEQTGVALTALAEAVLQAALVLLDPPVPLAVIAMGRFGGAELSYASDLDVLLVHRASSADDVAAAETAASGLLRLVNGTTPAERLYLLDADLRPEGRQGPLARSVDGYRTYYERWAQTWERQALVRARPVAGDPQVAAAFSEVAEAFVWRRPLDDGEIREIRRMKARVERERIPAGEDPAFHLKLGRGSLSDVEWTVQLLQLRHGVRAPGTMAALDALEAAGVIGGEDAAVLRDAYRFCERTRNRWFLVKGSAGDALPSQKPQLDRLAHSLDCTATELRDRYRRVTRRARQVVERLFYGVG